MLFVKVVQAGSFTQASLQLDFSKSQISRRMGILEQNLGVTLFFRTPRGIKLTDEGKYFYDDCLGVQVHFEHAKERLSHKQNNLKGQISITAPMSIGSQFLGPLLAKFLMLYPDIRISFDLSDKPRSLVDEDFDLAIRASQQLNDSQLRARCLYTYDYVIAASKGYLDKNGVPNEPTDIETHRAVTCITTVSNNRQRYWPFTVGGNEIEVRLNRVASVTHMWVQKQFALDGVGLIRVPRYWVSDMLDNQSLVSLLERYTSHQSHLYAVFKSSPMPERLRVLIDYIAQHLPNVLQLGK